MISNFIYLEMFTGDNMSPPAVRVNTFVEEKKTINLDRTSKIFILTELICGINRLPVFSNIKPAFIAISLIFSLSMNVTIIYLTCYKFKHGIMEYLDILKLSQYCMCALLGLALRKRLSNFYSELSTFDTETNFGGEMKDILKNVVQTCITVGFMIFLFIILYVFDIFQRYTIVVIVILLIHVAELHFFGHLLSLLIPRLRCIRHLMKFSFVVPGVTTIENSYNTENRKHLPDMRKLMDCYHRIIIAFDTLNDAIKWQMLIILVTTFISTLSLSYHITLQLIRNEYEVTNVLVNLMLTLVEMVPMFAPCRVVDAVHGEAQCLTQLLSSKLYENKIEKSSRSVAQALLALMEARDLSLSLLRIFDIDVSFPFKFLGLLVTYLIILLQFEKVVAGLKGNRVLGGIVNAYRPLKALEPQPKHGQDHFTADLPRRVGAFAFEPKSFTTTIGYFRDYSKLDARTF